MTHPQGHSAQILAFPAKLSFPVEQSRGPGRYPRGVASLRRVRAEKARQAAEAAEARLQAETLLEKAEAYLYAVMRLRGLIEG